MYNSQQLWRRSVWYWSSLHQQSNWTLSHDKVKLTFLLITTIIFPTFLLTAVPVVKNYLLKLPLAYYELQIHTILMNDFILSFTLALGPFATDDFSEKCLGDLKIKKWEKKGHIKKINYVERHQALELSINHRESPLTFDFYSKGVSDLGMLQAKIRKSLWWVQEFSAQHYFKCDFRLKT